MSNKPKTIEEAAKELRIAQDQYERARVEYENASRAETRAVNVLNEAQKNFDGVILEMKKNAPSRSDWSKTSIDRHEA